MPTEKTCCRAPEGLQRKSMTNEMATTICHLRIAFPSLTVAQIRRILFKHFTPAEIPSYRRVLRFVRRFERENPILTIADGLIARRVDFPRSGWNPWTGVDCMHAANGHAQTAVGESEFQRRRAVASLYLAARTGSRAER